MQKLVNFLEKNVQWVVLGLAGVFLLYMVWSYVLTPPVTVKIANRTLRPGEVADAILERPIERSRGEVPRTDLPPMVMPNFVRSFGEQMRGSEALALEWSPLFPAGELGGGTGPGPTDNKAFIVDGTPKPPAARPVDQSSGRSTISVVPAGWRPPRNNPAAKPAPEDMI